MPTEAQQAVQAALSAPLQERARDWGKDADYPWRVLVICVLCNQTPGLRAEPVAHDILSRYPSPVDMSRAAEGDEGALRTHLRLTVEPLGLQGRAERLLDLAHALIEHRAEGDELDVRALPGCGPYAADAYEIFVRGRLDVEPDDHVLRAWIAHVNQHTNTKEGEPRMATTAKKGAATGGEVQEFQVVSEVAKRAGMTKAATNALTTEQRARALKAPGGLTGKALAAYIVEGKTLRQQTREAAMHREVKDAADKTQRRSVAAKKAGVKPPTVRRYDPAITEGVKLAREARGASYAGPGAKQYALVLKALGGAKTDAKKIVAASGVKTEKALRDLAAGRGGREDLKPLHPLAEAIGKLDDEKVTMWCRGRNLASMLVAAVEQAKKGGR